MNHTKEGRTRWTNLMATKNIRVNGRFELEFFICSRVYPAHANPTIGFAPIEKLLVHRNVLFIIYINDLVDVLLCTPYKNVLNGALEALYRILVSIFHK